MIEVLKQMQKALREYHYYTIDAGLPNQSMLNKGYAAYQAGLKAIAELESQEPVAHRDGYWCADLTCKKCYSADFHLKHTPHPPQRTWQGLTDEEIKTICLDNGWDSSWQSLRFAQAIEAKLKEKNCAG